MRTRQSVPDWLLTSDALDEEGVYSYRLTGLARSATQQDRARRKQRAMRLRQRSPRPDDKTNFTFLSLLPE